MLTQYIHTFLIPALLAKTSQKHLSRVKEPRCGIRASYGTDPCGTSLNNLCDPKNEKTRKRFTNSNISSGNASEVGEWPWMVSFRLDDNKGEKKNFCSGSLIDRYHIHTVSEIAYLVRNCCAVAILMKICYNT